jgi:hypothetical protein
MRTTVTLDPDVERLLRGAMRERAISFKEALNEAARIGLGKGPVRARKFTQKSFRMGAGQQFRWDKALAVAEAIEDEELSRKLTLRK